MITESKKDDGIVKIDLSELLRSEKDLREAIEESSLPQDDKDELLEEEDKEEEDNG